jgi:serine/threonine-protein kinase
LAILGLVLVVESGYLIYLFLTDGPTEPPTAEVRVPDFVGRSLADARLIAEAIGLELVPTGRVSDQPISTILAQDPRSGTIVVQGSSVVVTIATGTETVTVPDLLGLPEADAVGLLAQVGLTVGVRTEAFDSVVAVGSVSGQQPQAGTEAARGTPVSYVVSMGAGSSPSGGPGPSPTPVATQTAPPTGGGLVVGDYRCLTLTDATRRLKADGFTLGSVAYTFEGGPVDATWLVDRQTPPPGERRPPGAAVDLVLSNPFFVCPG